MPYATNQQHVAWARRKRDDLIERLGGHCVACGSTEQLTLDHINPRSRTWRTNDHGFKGSVLRYVKDAKKGLLQVLCDHCNKVKHCKPWHQFQAEMAEREELALADWDQEVAA